MKISLIGMSGSGKSYWSQKLKSLGFKVFCCDDLIAQKLGVKGVADVSKWMGQPYENRYQETHKQYLSFETGAMEHIFNEVGKLDGNVVIDTTGSVIHLNPQILKSLRKLTKVIYLETPDSVKEQMFQIYMTDPKPVIWGDIFIRQKDESNFEALRNCYPRLLNYRSKKYQKIADINIVYTLTRKGDFDAVDFLKLLTHATPALSSRA